MNNDLGILTDAELDLIAGGDSNAVKDFYKDLHAMGIAADFVHLCENAVNTVVNVLVKCPIPLL